MIAVCAPDGPANARTVWERVAWAAHGSGRWDDVATLAIVEQPCAPSLRGSVWPWQHLPCLDLGLACNGDRVVEISGDGDPLVSTLSEIAAANDPGELEREIAEARAAAPGTRIRMYGGVGTWVDWTILS